ncbi:MAG: G1 family glutamic endopeptidase [Clostridia bacterium]
MVSLPAVVFASGTAVPAITNAPRLAAKPGTNGHGHGGGGGGGGTHFGWASSNWSGYALSGSAGSYSSITGQWTVPTVTPTKGSTYSSSWIGIDGFNNSSLIQTGTEQDYTSGKAQYYAWWEILPAAETVITGDTVKPGDTMTASITQVTSSSTWTITLSDKTQGWTFKTEQSYSGPAASAEWIEEAPTIGGHVATLANYGLTTFDPGTVNGGNPNLKTQDGGVMIQHLTQVSTPSVPDAEADGFAIQYGSTSPPAPTT